MNKIKVLSIAVLLSVMILPSLSFADKIIGIDLGADVPPGVFCEINEVRLIAQNADDCEKAGGVVLQSVNSQDAEDQASE